MNDYDKLFRRAAHEEEEQIPECVLSKIEETLEALPEQSAPAKKPRVRVLPRVAAVAASFFFVCLVLLPNCSLAYAKALEGIPVIGDIVRVVTIRNYFYSDANHEMDINVPEIEGSENQSVDYVNKVVDELTQALVERFYEELESVGNNGHGGIYVDYEVVTNTDEWFALKISILEVAGSGNTYYKFYNIDKVSGKLVELKDMFASARFTDVLEDEILRQMNERMRADDSVIYWTDEAEFGWSFVTLDAEHNFYWDENGDLVIAFDKYEVAPGAMGTPEFTISRSIIEDLLLPEYQNVP